MIENDASDKSKHVHLSFPQAKWYVFWEKMFATKVTM
jgi:hypothetical protein